MALAVYAFKLNDQYSNLKKTALDLQERASFNMTPRIQRVVFARRPFTILAGKTCVSKDCQPEMQGWQWAVANRVTNEGDCYGKNAPRDAGGCVMYVEALHYRMLPDD